MSRVLAGRLAQIVRRAFLFFALLGAGTASASFPGERGVIAHHRADSDGEAIWTTDPESGESFPLTSIAWSRDTDPEFSPDGREVVFERGSDVYAITVDGSDLRRVAEGRVESSTERRLIANYVDLGGSRTYPLARQTKEIQVWKGVYDPAFDHTGRVVVVERDDKEVVVEQLCAVAPADPGTCIPPDNPGHFQPDPVIAERGSTHLERLDAHTGERLGDATAPHEGVFDESPTYSVDGSLAFHRTWAGGASAIVVRSPEGEELVVADSGNGIAPDFAPDGRSLAFSEGGRELAIVSLPDGAVSRITVPPIPGASFDSVARPSHAPDGTAFAFERTVWGGDWFANGIYVIPLDSMIPSLVAANAWKPAWQPLPTPEPEPEPHPEPTPAPGPSPLPDQVPRPESRHPPALDEGRRPGFRRLDLAPIVRLRSSVRLGRDGLARIGWVRCRSTVCLLRAKRMKLVIAGRRFSVRLIAPRRLGRGAVADIRIRPHRRLRPALSRHGRGRLRLHVQAKGRGTAVERRAVIDLHPPRQSLRSGTQT